MAAIILTHFGMEEADEHITVGDRLVVCVLRSGSEHGIQDVFLKPQLDKNAFADVFFVLSVDKNLELFAIAL